jgi:hypothetical protein
MSLQHLYPTMKRETKANSRFARRAILVLLAISIFAALAGSGAAQTKRPQPAQAAVVEALNGSFGAAVEAVTEFKPFYLTGDFNGDSAEDLLIVVRIKGRRGDLPREVRIVDPFHYATKTTFPADPANQVTLALAIIHGSRTGWKAAPVAGRFLLFGESPVLALESVRMRAQPEAREQLIEIIRKRGKRPRGSLPPPPDAKGDMILLGTEAADSFLYWNGKTYRWYESEGSE